MIKENKGGYCSKNTFLKEFSVAGYFLWITLNWDQWQQSSQQSNKL